MISLIENSRNAKVNYYPYFRIIQNIKIETIKLTEIKIILLNLFYSGQAISGDCEEEAGKGEG